MGRFFLGLLLGVVLTAQAVAIAGVGHGSYAPLFFTASVLAFVPIISLLLGPLLWAFYFLLIPIFDRLAGKLIAMALVVAMHAGPGFWAAVEDPALSRAGSAQLLIFGITALGTIGCLTFLCVRRMAGAN